MSDFIIQIDSREQSPWTFPDHTCEIQALKTGDYSLEGLADKFVIERKQSTNEISNNVSKKRWEDCLRRLSKIKYSFIILEFNLTDVLNFPYNSGIPKRIWQKLRISSNFLLRNICEWQTRYRINVIFAGNRENAQEIALGLMKSVWKRENRDLLESEC